MPSEEYPLRPAHRRSGARHATRRTLVILSCLIVGISVLTGMSAAAPDPDGTARPQPNALARSALAGILRQPTQQGVDAAVRQAHRTVADKAARTPSAVGGASLVFAEGLAPAGAADFLARHGLDLISAEAKAPVGTTGQVATLWFNDFEQFGGTLPQKLERAVGKARLRNLRQADAAPAKEKAGLRALAYSDIRFYRIEVAAPYGTLADLVNAPQVVAVLPAAGDAEVTALHNRRAKFAAARRAAPAAPEVRLLSGDPAASGTRKGVPVVTNSGQRCTWQSNGALACGPATTSPRISGDPAVDATLPRGAGAATAGTTKAASSLGTQAVSNAFTDCNVPSNPEGCPNDFTYSPRPQTSGGQSFAALVNAYPAGSVIFYECYIQWVPGNGGSPNDGGSWQTVCYPYAINTAAFTYGAAAWRSVWGTQRTNVAPNVDLPVSTLAFKASQLTNCDVDQSGATARCDPSDQNAIYVPSPGVEDELLIDNPACSAQRNGSTDDWNHGCFYPTYAQSDLPSPYLDTTFEDGPAPAPYNLAVGSTNPAAIAEGAAYTSYAEFFSWGYNDMIGRRAWHSVSVDSQVILSAACIGNFGDPAFCYFPVDAVRVSETAFFTSG